MNSGFKAEQLEIDLVEGDEEARKKGSEEGRAREM